jgi:hypothetical protein
MQLKIYTWALIILTDLIVYFVAAKMRSKKVAVLSVAAFAVWQLFFDGNGLWFDLMLAPISVLTFLLLSKKHYFWTSIFWAFMFFTKQTAVWFLVPIAIVAFRDKKELTKNVDNLVLGSALVIVIWVIGLWMWGVLPGFYNWAINFGIFVLPKASGQIQLPDLKALTVTVFPFLLFIPLIWKTGRKNINLLIWAIAGALGAYPRFEYFHIQPAIPFLALATGVFFSGKFLKEKLVKIFVVFYALGSLYLFGGFFMRNFKEGVRFYEQDVQDIVSYVQSNTNAGDKVFVMNWWDNVYALSDRLPAVNPWVPQLSWYMEITGIQEKIVNDLASSKPKLIILNPYSGSGLSAYIPQKVYTYVMANYKLKEKVDNLEVLIHE